MPAFKRRRRKLPSWTFATLLIVGFFIFTVLDSWLLTYLPRKWGWALSYYAHTAEPRRRGWHSIYTGFSLVSGLFMAILLAGWVQYGRSRITLRVAIAHLTPFLSAVGAMLLARELGSAGNPGDGTFHLILFGYWVLILTVVSSIFTVTRRPECGSHSTTGPVRGPRSIGYTIIGKRDE